MVLGVNQILSALADETRRNILMLLRKGKISSGEIAENLEMTPQALSYHLKKLREADLIYETKYKNFIYYELNLTVLDDAIMWMNQLMGGNHNENK
ncbi:MAG: winged helix-turn-helix transcriptional regulator [Globicatella sulfidifaciens]|uniref:Winged helix-turn-helix transcriptional regulator n=1 Tax=Globicatella sulfidifaciens TaxID=136093 RepID=A0A7X8H1E0_9LACT|nr:winged helix-turn-helix transcriptional regulator [Globicatella sulfidifaciens]